jgi:DNA helicase II / ATP-dependent DNA helicase PcrA
MSYTDEQLAAIEHSGGHSLTFAVPGSGKTHMLVGRVIWLLEHGVEARRIRVLAFNKDAAREFKERLAGTLPTHLKAPEVSTFHSLGLKLVNLFVAAGLLPNLKLESSEAFEKKLAREAAVQAVRAADPEAYPSQDDINTFHRFIGLVKSDLLSAADAFKAFRIDKGLTWCVPAYGLFEDARLRAGVRFFSDLLTDPVRLMRSDPRALGMVTNKLDFLLVDEFQDSSRIQLELLVQLIGTRAKLNAVGDDSQCIYAWRGSRPEFMGDTFEKFFPGAARYTLSLTFRFGHRLSLAAAMLIANNSERMDTLCVSAEGTPATDIEVLVAMTTGDQSAVADRIEQWRREGRGLNECAVLTRLWAQTLALEIELLHRGVPYHKDKGNVFAVPEIIGLLGWLRLANGSLFGAASTPMVVQAMLSTPTLYVATPAVKSAAEAIAAAPERAQTAFDRLAATRRQAYQREPIEDRAALWLEASGWGERPAAEVLRHYARRTALTESFAKSADSEAASEKRIAYETLVDWAERLGLPVAEFLSRMDMLREAKERMEAGGDVVRISTVHRAKGLQWPLVVVGGLESGAFPSPRSDIEEERRLAYVAISRAQERACLVTPPDERLRAALDGTSARRALPAKIGASRFLFEAQLHTAIGVGDALEVRRSASPHDAELPPAPVGQARLLNRYLAQIGAEDRYEEPAAPAAPLRAQDFALNDAVHHAVFGPGTVMGFVGTTALDIDFGGTLRRVDIAQYPVERIEDEAA